MDTSLDAARLVHYISSLDNFSITEKSYQSYEHMGAILTDAILQAGLNYKTVVVPRVRRVIEQYPEAYTTSVFLSVIEDNGANHVLNWQHHEKPRRLYEITTFLFQTSIDTEDDLRSWLSTSQNGQSLLEIKGIGPKTVDYLKNLVNVSSIAVDRHIRKFVFDAGITCKGYIELQSIVEHTADLLNVSSSCLDHAIWLYMSNKSSNKGHVRNMLQ